MSVIDDYVAQYEGAHRALLNEVVALIRTLVPEAGEKIAWGMPTFTLNGNLIHVAAAKHHIGLYPSPAGVEFAAPMLDELGLKYSKGAIQLPIDRPLERKLVEDIIRFRVEQQKK